MENGIKFLCFALAILIMPIISTAQLIPPHADTQNNNTFEKPSKSQFLTDGEGVRMSAFVATDFEVSQIGEDLAFGSGGSANLIFNRSVYFGLYGMGVLFDINDWDFDPNMDIDIENDFEIKALGHGGFQIGGVFAPDKIVHAGARLRIGAGNLVIGDNNLVRNDFVFIASPQIEAELNVARWFKIKAGIGYRYATGLRTDSFYTKDYLNSPTGSLSLVFGWFGENKIFERSKIKNNRNPQTPLNSNSMQL